MLYKSNESLSISNRFDKAVQLILIRFTKSIT
jgi:hypothetical protein